MPSIQNIIVPTGDDKAFLIYKLNLCVLSRSFKYLYCSGFKVFGGFRCLWWYSMCTVYSTQMTSFIRDCCEKRWAEAMFRKNVLMWEHKVKKSTYNPVFAVPILFFASHNVYLCNTILNIRPRPLNDPYLIRIASSSKISIINVFCWVHRLGDSAYISSI